MSNQGTTPVLLPAVFLAGASSENRSSALYSIKSGGPLTDEEFALAVWQFVMNNAGHYCVAGSPGDPNMEALEPLRILGGYGFACCDQSSRVMDWLWQGGGYPSRLVLMSFHTVPEIYYAGAWHMYDADHQVYYLAEDNVTVASVAQLIADPSLVARVQDANGNDPAGFSAQGMANLYASASPEYYTFDYSTAATYSLQPAESFTLWSRNLGDTLFDGSTQDPGVGPWTVRTGQFEWDIDFSRSDWGSLTTSQTGVATLNNGDQVALTNSASTAGNVVYHLSSPFPAFDLQVSGMVYLADSSAVANVYLSADGKNWSSASPLAAPIGAATQTIADLTAAASGQYDYYIKLEVAGNAAQAAQVANVQLISQVQASSHMFPSLVGGEVNHLTYQDWNSATDQHNVQVSFTVQ
jgi:hypothetical protein